MLAITAAAAALSVAGFTLMLSRNLAARDAPIPLPASFHPLLTALRANHVDRLWASCWIAYRVTFESNEHIIAALPGSTRYTVNAEGRVRPADLAAVATGGRYRPYQLAVARAPDTAFVFAPRETGEASARPTLLSTHPRRQPRRLAATVTKAALGTPDYGPAWIRTRDQGIMSPLL